MSLSLNYVIWKKRACGEYKPKSWRTFFWPSPNPWEVPLLLFFFLSFFFTSNVIFVVDLAEIWDFHVLFYNINYLHSQTHSSEKKIIWVLRLNELRNGIPGRPICRIVLFHARRLQCSNQAIGSYSRISLNTILTNIK